MLMKHLLKYQESNLSNELLFQCMSPKRAEINDPKRPENLWVNIHRAIILPPFALFLGSCSKFNVYHLDFGNRFFSRNPASKCSTKGPLAALASLQNERNGSWSLVSINPWWVDSSWDWDVGTVGKMGILFDDLSTCKHRDFQWKTHPFFCCWLVVLSVLCGKKWFVNKESHVVTPWLLGESKMVVEGPIMRIVPIRKHNVYRPLWRSLFFVFGKMCTFNACPTWTSLHLRVQRKRRKSWKVKTKNLSLKPWACL